MNLNEIESKCFIMALFIRDDGLRFLLGSGAYEFKDSQLMFAGNTIENDVVAVQGNDGYMLAGQVRRPSTQVFDGYIGDASVPKSEVEGYRRDFMAFFQKNHFYTVVYVMADGSAIQRRRGFLVDAPTSQELWQMYPEYHVALNFEDVNYYKYSENDDGEETYAKSADIGLAKVQYGGLIWDNNSDIEVSGSGTNIELDGTIAGGAIKSVEMYGDTEQATYTGKNLLDESLMVQGTFNYLNNQDSAHSGIIRMSSFIPCQSNTTYTISSNAILGEFAVVYKDSNGNVVEGSGWSIENSTYTSFTTKSNAVQMRVRVGKGAYPHTAGVDYALQIELGGQPTSYEPYVGGMASPNPDYPQEVQTVTGEQTITVSNGQGESQVYPINLGKNLFDTEQAVTKFENSAGATVASWGSYSDGVVTITRSNGAYGATLFAGFIPKLIEGETYTLSATVRLSGTASGTGLRIGTNDTTPVYITLSSKDTWLDASFTFTATAQIASDPRICINANNTGNIVEIKNIQLERGSVATTYAPYFTPIELCKIGTYQDYIYKSGEDWYIHKETGKVTFTGAETETWSSATAATGYVRFSTASGETHADNNGYCNELINRGSQSHGAYEYVWVQPNANAFYIQVLNTRVTDLSSFRTWLGANPATVYYDITTSTDTQITNSALIAQLEALNEATTYDGTTVITVASENLASPLEITVISIGGGGVVWDENGAEWEAGGGGEIVIVNVDSIENILPVWTIRGEAENPTLTNLTTGMSITYNGTVASGQTLVIDLLNKTAKLNGTSVISDVSGQWVEFKPGNNRVSYSTENANAPDSTIEWQEVVG